MDDQIHFSGLCRHWNLPHGQGKKLVLVEIMPSIKVWFSSYLNEPRIQELEDLTSSSMTLFSANLLLPHQMPAIRADQRAVLGWDDFLKYNPGLRNEHNLISPVLPTLVVNDTLVF